MQINELLLFVWSLASMKKKYSNNRLFLILVIILVPLALIGGQLINDEKNHQLNDASSSSVDNSAKNNLASNNGYFQYDTNVVWAVNVGGTKYVGVDGISYQADTSTSSLITGDVGNIEKIKGSQDSFIYESFRSGELTINHPLENGLYDIIFKFAVFFN